MARLLESGQPCDHKGCLSHTTHPCELCGRIAGEGVIMATKNFLIWKAGIMAEARNYPILKDRQLNEHMLIAYFHSGLSNVEVCNDMLTEV